MKELLQKMLTHDRYIHSIGVCETAVELAKLYGCDTQKAYTAGLLHDAAKDLSVKEMMSECERLGVKLDEIEKLNTVLIHATMGGEYVMDKFSIYDEEIKSAIKYHTTGKADMTLLEKIIYLSDMIEPNRKFDGVDEIRYVAYENIDRACILSLTQSVFYNLKKGVLIHPNTIIARNSLIIKSNV